MGRNTPGDSAENPIVEAIKSYSNESTDLASKGVLPEDPLPEIGITAYAQEQLGDVVFVELPAVGKSVTSGAVMGNIESVKAVSAGASGPAGVRAVASWL